MRVTTPSRATADGCGWCLCIKLLSVNQKSSHIGQLSGSHELDYNTLVNKSDTEQLVASIAPKILSQVVEVLIVGHVRQSMHQCYH